MDNGYGLSVTVIQIIIMIIQTKHIRFDLQGSKEIRLAFKLMYTSKMIYKINPKLIKIKDKSPNFLSQRKKNVIIMLWGLV